MRSTTLTVLVGLAWAGVAPLPAATAQPSDAVTWDAEGLAELPRLLAQAQHTGRRLLVGLSGGPG